MRQWNRAFLLAAVVVIGIACLPAQGSPRIVPTDEPRDAPIELDASFRTGGGLAGDRILGPIRATIRNVSGRAITILWDECSLIDPDGVSQRVILELPRLC